MDWTPISEDYPQDGQEVIFTTEELTTHVRLVQKGIYHKKVDEETGEITDIFSRNDVDYNDGKRFKVKAWMPTPEAFGGSNFNVIVAGGRQFSDYNLLKTTLDKLFSTRKPTAIVCGEAKGADTLGKKYAEEHRIPVISMPADWNKYGKQAGYIRNEEMAKKAQALVAFWDGSSSGTKHMIETAKAKGMPVRTIRY